MAVSNAHRKQGADVFIYRVGTYGEIMTVMVLDGVNALIAEFRRRVAQQRNGGSSP